MKNQMPIDELSNAISDLEAKIKSHRSKGSNRNNHVITISSEDLKKYFEEARNANYKKIAAQCIKAYATGYRTGLLYSRK